MPWFPTSPVVRAALLLAAILAGAARAATMPLVVAHLADATIAALADVPPSDGIKETYARGFFVGFVNPDTDYGHSPGVEGLSIRDGQAYWKAHPEERDQIFRGYGYTRVMVEGTWTLGWEQNDFVPVGHADEVWSVADIGPSRDAGRDNWTHRGLQDAPVLVTGYVSSTGQAERGGHMRRWLEATSIVREPSLEPPRFALPVPSNLLPIPGAM